MDKLDALEVLQLPVEAAVNRDQNDPKVFYLGFSLEDVEGARKDGEINSIRSHSWHWHWWTRKRRRKLCDEKKAMEEFSSKSFWLAKDGKPQWEH